MGTPPFPEYTSGHSVQSGAAARVLTAFFGDDYAFVDDTHVDRVPPLAPRTFGSFDEAADEAAISRLYGGIHYRSAIDLGVEQGRVIGDVVADLHAEVTDLRGEGTGGAVSSRAAAPFPVAVLRDALRKC